MQAHDIHVALDDHETLQRRARLAHLVETVELAALVEQRRLRRVQVFRLALVDDAAAAGDHAAAGIADREHQPVAEAVVMALAALALCAVALDDQTRLGERAAARLVDAEAAQHVVPGIRGVADQEALERRGLEAAARGVVGGAAIGLQGLRPVRRDARQHRVQRLARCLRVVGPPGLARDVDAGARGQLLDRLGEAQAVVVHQEAEHGAVRAAAEAVVELLVRAHPERRRLLVVEGAAGLVFAARFLQRDARADQLDDVAARDQVIDEALRDATGHRRGRRFSRRGGP